MKLERLTAKEKKYVLAHQAEIDTLIDYLNDAPTPKKAGVMLYQLLHFMFRLGRRFEQDD
jgi:hypothetical protein